MKYMIAITSFYHSLKAVLQADVLRIVHEDQPTVSRRGVSSYADPHAWLLKLPWYQVSLPTGLYFLYIDVVSS